MNAIPIARILIVLTCGAVPQFAQGNERLIVKKDGAKSPSPGSFLNRLPPYNQDRREPPIGMSSEAAIARSLQALVRFQGADGRWRYLGDDTGDIAVTASALLPFLAVNKTHKPDERNPYTQVVAKGLKLLISKQNEQSGAIGTNLHSHAQATTVICEAYGLTKDPELRKPAQKAIDLIVNTQGEDGGWQGMTAKNKAGTLSVSGAQIMTLKTAQFAGLEVPDETFRKANAFLDTCCTKDEGYGAFPGGPARIRETAVGLLCRQYLQNWGPKNPRLAKAVRKFIRPNGPEGPDLTYRFYATQVMFHLGGDDWRDWNERMRDHLVKTQVSDKKNENRGTWDSQNNAVPRLTETALNTLCLEVRYRFTPLFR